MGANGAWKSNKKKKRKREEGVKRGQAPNEQKKKMKGWRGGMSKP